MNYGRKIIKNCLKILSWLCVAGPGVLICVPPLLLFCGSLADEIEWGQRIAPLLKNNQEYIEWKWIPDYPTLGNYKELLFYAPDFLVLFWNSVKTAAYILGGQFLVDVPAAWAFAVYRFRGKQFLFSVYVILMLLPFQSTMLAKYLVLNGMGFIDTGRAVILPAIFSTFPVFLIYRGFRTIPQELFEAARTDGAGEFEIFFRIGMPLAEGSITAAFVLSFFEIWNMVEEPLAFLKNISLWPLSLYLSQIGPGQAGRACAASVITLAVSLFVFGVFRGSFEQGIIFSRFKL